VKGGIIENIIPKIQSVKTVIYWGQGNSHRKKPDTSDEI